MHSIVRQIGDWRTTIVETWINVEQSYIDKLMDDMTWIDRLKLNIVNFMVQSIIFKY